jgi:hypothetical protein
MVYFFDLMQIGRTVAALVLRVEFRNLVEEASSSIRTPVVP